MTAPYLNPFGANLQLPKWLVNPETDDEFAQRFPGTYGDPVSAPEAVPPQPTQGPGWQARLFGGADPLAGGLLNSQDARGLGRQSLLNFGVNVLQNSGPSPYKRGLGEILAGGVLSGQQAYQQGTQQALGAQGIVTQRQNQARLQALHQRYAGRNDAASLTSYLNDLIGIGTPEALAAARSLSEVLKSQQQPNGPRLIRSEEMVDGRRKVVFRDAQTGQVVTQGEGQPPASSGSQTTDRRFNYTMAKDWESRFLNPQRKAVEAYHLFQSHLREAERGSPEAYKSLISAFAANADPFNQLRLGMLQYLSEVNPSAAGRFEVMMEKLRTGTLPQADLRNLAALVNSNFREIGERYRNNYQEFVGRQPGVEEFLTSPDSFLGQPAGRAPATGGGNVNPITGRPRGR